MIPGPTGESLFKITVPKGEGGAALRNRRRTTKSVRQQVSDLITEALDRVLKLAKEMTPVSEDGSLGSTGWNSPGELRRSGVKVKNRGATEGFVAFGNTLEWGGADAPYAVYVHENLGFNEDQSHRIGEGKFLEKAVLKVKPWFLRELAKIFKSVKNWEDIEDLGSGKEPRADVRDSRIGMPYEGYQYTSMRG